jgi:hypothetical protein
MRAPPMWKPSGNWWIGILRQRISRPDFFLNRSLLRLCSEGFHVECRRCLSGNPKPGSEGAIIFW